MILRYFGHSLFQMDFENGRRLITDPYGKLCQYPWHDFEADACTVSHQHYDHNAVDMLKGSPIIVDQPGTHALWPDLTVTGVSTWHDERHGAQRGENTVFVIESEGLRIAHMGDLGHMLSEDQARAIGRVDVLLLPVGGYYTIDAATAVRVMERLSPRVAIPMHYQTEFSREMPIEPADRFLRLCNAAPEPMKLCRLTAADLAQRPPIVLMDIA
ncbi:MAG: MBL fold metallo-hydrolase [Eubacteriales bacterium]|nr:MBL fold metallo-hydrolase [Eubacteriales bacterium]